MKKLFATILCFAPVIWASTASAQTGSIQGKIFDEKTKEPLIGASVLIIGTTMGTSTNLDGEYVVSNIPIGTYEVRFSFVGYERKIVTEVMVEADESLELNVGDQSPRSRRRPKSLHHR